MMLFRFFCDFHFFCFQVCSVCFCVVLQFRGLSFSLFTHNFFRLLCVCVCVCARSQWPRHCQILCCIFCILFFQRLYPDLSRISNSSVCGIHQLQIWKIPHQVDVNLELLFFFSFGKAFFICILLTLFCNSWVYSLYVAKCICTTDSWWQQSNIFLHVGGVQETLVLLGLLYVSIRLEIRKCFWKDLFQSRARDEWGEIAVGKTGGHCRWLGECKREWDLLCSWEISDNHNEQVEAAVGSTRQSNLCRLWSPWSQMGVCLSLSLSLPSSQNISKWKFDIVTFTIIEGFCFPDCMIICFVGVLYARNSVACWFLVPFIFCNMNHVRWWWVQNQETLSGLASLLHQPYSWILFMLHLDVGHDFCLLVR